MWPGKTSQNLYLMGTHSNSSKEFNLINCHFKLGGSVVSQQAKTIRKRRRHMIGRVDVELLPVSRQGNSTDYALVADLE